MRNIRLLSLINRINCLNKNTSLLNKANCFSSLSSGSNKLLVKEDDVKFNNSYRNSSGHSQNSSAFSQQAIVYTILGSAFFGGLLVFNNLNFGSSKNLKTQKPSQAEAETVAEQEEEAPVEAEPEEAKVEEPVEVKKEVTKVESKPAEVAKESKAAKLDEEKFLPEIPNYAQYLIVGGGTAAMSAFKAIRARDPTAKVLVVTEESHKPYMRPPLSKDLWTTDDENLIKQLRFKQYNGNERSLMFLEDEFYVAPKYLNEQENGGVAVLTGKRVTEVDIENKKVKLDNSWEIVYDKCLIATGGKPKNLPYFEKSWEKFQDKVTLFRNVEDFKRLYEVAKQGKTIAIVGGGFLGSELACALAHMSKKYGGSVVQVFPEEGNLRRILPQYLSEWTTKRVKEEGVSIVAKTSITGAKLNDDKIELNLEPTNPADGPKAKWLLADHVVVAVGLEPNVQLAKKSGFEIDQNLGGYLVNAELQARNGIWVAGDAACFYDVKLGRRRVEHHDHAVVSGRLAGENMTGAGKPYWHQSMFWSDLGPKIGFEAIGLVDSSLQTVGLFAKADENDTPQAQVNQSNETLRSEVQTTNIPEAQANEPRQPLSADEYGKGVVLYLKNDKIVGCLLWNVFNRIPVARQLIQSQEKVTDFKEMAKLFKINATGMEDSGN